MGHYVCSREEEGCKAIVRSNDARHNFEVDAFRTSGLPTEDREASQERFRMQRRSSFQHGDEEVAEYGHQCRPPFSEWAELQADGIGIEIEEAQKEEVAGQEEKEGVEEEVVEEEGLEEEEDLEKEGLEEEEGIEEEGVEEEIKEVIGMIGRFQDDYTRISVMSADLIL